MASEPKKPIEQMLEALAKARRAEFGGDPKMPNPMRARLHEEIARAGTAEEESVESRPSWVTMFWPRVTVAAALATLLVRVPAIWWNQSHSLVQRGDVALRDRTAAAANGLNPAVPAQNTLAKAPAVSATEPTVNLADNNQIKIEPTGMAAAKADALASSTGVQQGRGTTEFPSQETKGFDKEIASAKIQAAPAAAPPAGADSNAKSDRMVAAAPPVSQPSSAGSVGTKQQFSQQSAVQSFRNNAQQASGTANVLNTFQVQQDGNEIRVLDADGSMYTGKIEQLAKNAELASRMSSQRYAAKRAPKNAAQVVEQSESATPESYFRVTGFNLSLKKRLVFEGNYAALPAQQPTKATSNNRERTEQTSERGRIVGTVRVNGEAPVEVNAVAETPETVPTKKSKN
jgi:hypothetical protein